LTRERRLTVRLADQEIASIKAFAGPARESVRKGIVLGRLNHAVLDLSLLDKKAHLREEHWNDLLAVANDAGP
jgi:hypothetical protein